MKLHPDYIFPQVGEKVRYTGTSRRIPKDVMLEVVESNMPVATPLKAPDGRRFYCGANNLERHCQRCDSKKCKHVEISLSLDFDDHD